MSTEELLQALAGDGWATIEQIDRDDLSELIAGLGGTTSVSHLRTREADGGSRLSLSAMHGRGEFPPHTDGAARPTPPRFVALWSGRSHEAATHLYDGEDPALCSPAFARAWLVDGGGRPFYAVPRRSVGGRVRWRLNPDIMHPVAEDGGTPAAMAPFASMAKLRVEWEPGLAVIWDNGRMLHSREAVGPGDGERELMRVSVA